MYIILIDERDIDKSVKIALNEDEVTAEFEDIADAIDFTNTDEACEPFPCEILDLNELGFRD